MFGALYRKLNKSKESHVESYLHRKHHQIKKEILKELRMIYIIEKFNTNEINRLMITIKNRYDRILNTLHQRTDTHTVIIQMKEIGEVVRSNRNHPNRVKYMRKYMSYFDHLSLVRFHEKQIVGLYLESFEQVIEILKYEYHIDYIKWPYLPPLNTLFVEK